MKEFIEKLNERLEELRKEYYADYNTYRVERDLGNVDGLKHAIKIINELAEEYIPCTNPCTDCEAYDLVKHNCPKFCKVIKETVEELAEEYNNDFCEWKFDATGIVWNCNGCETYNLPYAMSLRIVVDDFECKCPYCKKKIKTIE